MNNFQRFLESLQEAVVTRKKFKGVPKKMKPAEKKAKKKREKIKKLLNIQPGSKFKLGKDPNTGKPIKVKKTPEEILRKIKTIQ